MHKRLNACYDPANADICVSMHIARPLYDRKVSSMSHTYTHPHKHVCYCTSANVRVLGQWQPFDTYRGHVQRLAWPCGCSVCQASLLLYFYIPSSMFHIYIQTYLHSIRSEHTLRNSTQHVNDGLSYGSKMCVLFAQINLCTTTFCTVVGFVINACKILFDLSCTSLSP